MIKRTISRRRFLAAAAGVIGGGSLSARAVSAAEASMSLGRQPAGLPARQFAWTATLANDSHGNAISPRYDRLLFFDVQHARRDRRPAA